MCSGSELETMKPSYLIRQASSPAGLVLPFFLCLLFFASSMVLAQKGKGKQGNLSSAIGLTDSLAIWNIATSDGGYRLVAKGQNRKARVIYLLSLATPSVQ